MYANKSKVKTLISFCFVLTFFSCITAYLNPAKGYEISLYESTPFIVWASLILSISGGVYVIIHQVYTNEYKHSKLWLIGVFSLVLNRICLLYIPYIRGYFSWRGDNISHLGLLRDILFYGHIGRNSYPITHILLTEIKYISGFPIEFIANHSTALFSIFYVISIYLLSCSIFTSKKQVILSTVSVCCVLFNNYDIYLMPNGWTILYLPFFFYLYFKKEILEYSILYVTVLILYPFFHPLSSFMIIIMLLIVGIVKYLLNIIENKKMYLRIIPYFPLTSLSIEFTIFTSWILSSTRFYPNIINLYESLTKGSGSNALADMSSTLGKVHISGFEFIKLILKIMGDELIFIILSLISFIIILRSSAREKKNYENLLILLALTFFVGLLYTAHLFNIIPGLENFGSDRLTAYLVIFTPISAGFVFKYLIDGENRFKGVNLRPILCSIIIMSASIISIFSLYPSPYIIQPNTEVTDMDAHGANWFVNFKNTSIYCADIMTPPNRFASGIFGVDYTNNRDDIQNSLTIPDHFNYSNKMFLGDSYNKDRYSMITKFDTIIYRTVWRVVGRFNDRDFDKLKSDPTVEKLYSNGETNVYSILYS